MESIWQKTTNIAPRPALTEDRQCEAVVIGAGMAGLLTAYFLQQRGVETIVLEAARIASGQTRGTTAKITAQHGPVYHRLLQRHGPKAARGYAVAQRQAIADYWSLANAEHIDCALEQRPAWLYSSANQDMLRDEAAVAARLGFATKLSRDTELPFPAGLALCFAEQAQFHPLRFAAALAEKLTIYEHTRVATVEDMCVHSSGGTVRAKHIVFAAHYPFINAPGYYFTRMHQSRSYLLALENAQPLEGMYLGCDADGLTLRSAGDILLFGNSGHRSGENCTGGQYRGLRWRAAQYWPRANALARWSAQDCISADGLPFIGVYAASQPNWYVATGFGKWGMSNSMVAARLLADLITGHKNAAAELFAPQRFDVGASAKRMLEDGGKTVRALSRRMLEPPRAALDALPAGHGGIVAYGEEKAGVYRDAAGAVHAVRPVCPHLGCQLEWNPDELSWDCPCHGSRFDHRGRLLDGPAQHNLMQAGEKGDEEA